MTHSWASDLGIAEHDFRLVLGRTKIEFDPDKEEANRAKHGYSLLSAVALMEQVLLPLGPSSPFATSDAFSENGEIRHMHLGVDDGGKVVLIVSTMRPDETVRIISFRRASSDERERFTAMTGYVEPA